MQSLGACRQRHASAGGPRDWIDTVDGLAALVSQVSGPAPAATALALRVYALDGGSDPGAAYLELGAQTKRQIVGLLPDDWSFEGKRVLDFGSGAGRTLRHFADEAERAEFWGCDIDGPSIEWMRQNLCPPFHAGQTISVPPLALEHGSFDLMERWQSRKSLQHLNLRPFTDDARALTSRPGT
jgi:hypothetical protein